MTRADSPGVLHLISSLNVGGAERLLVDLGHALTDAPDRRHVFVVMNAAHDPRMVSALREAGFPVVLMQRPPGHRHPRYLAQLLAVMREHGIGIVHAHNRGSKFWAMAAKLARPRTRLVMTMHNTGIAPAMGAWELRVHRRLVDATISISRAVAEECRTHGLGRVEQIDNGIDIGRFRVRRAKPVLASGAPRLLCVGRYLPEQKGQDVLIAATGLMRDAGQAVRLDLAGPRTPETDGHRKDMETQAAELGLADAVTFHDDRTDTPRMLADADIFVLPSRFEGFGLVVLEAMAAGVPVVASRVGGPAGIIADGQTGLLVPPDDPRALADAIAGLIGDPARARCIAKNAAAAVERYAITRMRDAYLELYDRVVGSAGASATAA